MKAYYNKISNSLFRVGLSPPSLAVFVLLSFAPGFIKDEYTMHLLATCLLFGTLAMGFDLSGGFIGVANWGYGALMGLGAYTSALLLINMGISQWIGIVIGGLFTAVLGMIIGVLTLKMDGMFAGIFSWFVGLVLMALATALVGITRGTRGLSVPLFFDTAWAKPYVYIILVICIVTFIALRLITQSRLGLAFMSLGQDIEAAGSSGINPMKFKVINFTISCFIAGLCGGFYAHFIGILTPDLMNTRHTLEILAIAFIGGRGSVWGPLLAAFIIIPIFNYLDFLMELKFVIYGVLLIVVMVVYPSGLSGLITQAIVMIKKRLQSH